MSYKLYKVVLSQFIVGIVVVESLIEVSYVNNSIRMHHGVYEFY